MMGSSCLVCVAVLLKVGSLPKINDITINVMGANLVARDAVINSMMTVAIIMVFKVVPFLGLVVPGKQLKTVLCGLYYPSCHLVPVPLVPPTARKLLPMITPVSFDPILVDKFGVIDTRHTISDSSTLASMRVLTSSRVFDWIGYIGLLSSFTSYVWHVSSSSFSSTLSPIQHILAIVGLFATIFYVLVCMMHAQRTLLRLLIRQFDMWFVVIQWTMMIISASDQLNWDSRILTLWSSCLWCHWTLYLDALPPTIRRSIGYRPHFNRTVLVILVVYPILLLYWIFYSGTANISNNYIMHFKIGQVDVIMKTSTFLASRILTVWLWMVRFLWCYSPNKLMFIRRRLQYPLVPDSVMLQNFRASNSEQLET